MRPEWIILQNWRGAETRVRVDAITAYVADDATAQQGVLVWVEGREQPLYATRAEAQVLDRLFEPKRPEEVP